MGQYDTAQICLSGHIITDSSDSSPQLMKPFCPKCGERTIVACPSCNTPIQGYYHVDGVFSTRGMGNAPAFCYKCGKSFPWTESRIQAAIEAFVESGKLDEKELEQTKKDITTIARDIPQAEPAAMRIKRTWGKYGKIAYNVIMEFASKIAAEILKNP